jgi:hypothetical protein
MASRDTITSATPMLLRVANILGLSTDMASSTLRRGAFRVSERAGTTQQHRMASVASEAIWAMMEATCKVDPGGHFEQVCAAVRLRAGGGGGGGGDGGGGGRAAAAPSVMALQRQRGRPLQAATVVGLLCGRQVSTRTPSLQHCFERSATPTLAPATAANARSCICSA